MPRESRKRGKQVKKRGISNEQVCIGTGIDNDGRVIMEMVCTGRITSEKLEKLYDGHLCTGTIIITDSLSSYELLSKKLKLRHKQIPAGKHLVNYLVWFKWLEVVKGSQETAKPNMMWKDSMAKPVDVRIGTIREREPVWV